MARHGVLSFTKPAAQPIALLRRLHGMLDERAGDTMPWMALLLAVAIAMVVAGLAGLALYPLTA